MKTIFKLILTVIAFGTFTMSNAATNVSVKITNVSMVNVTLSNVTSGERLYLKDFNGDILFNLKLDKAKSFNKYFNFSQAEDGIYFIETETEHSVKVTPILKNAAGVSIVEESSVTVFKPQLKIEGKKVKVLFYNVGNVPLDVIIFDNDYTIVDEVSGNLETEFKRTYDFSKLPSGTYNLYFELNERSFLKTIDL